MIKKLNIKRQDIYRCIIVVIYVIFHIILMTKHEAWRDEAQAWVLTKNSSIQDIFSYLHIEGHPCLWFLIIYPFTRLGVPFAYISLISIFFTSLAVFLLLYKSPFPEVYKLLIICSSIFMYFNPIISRIYAVVILVIVIMAWQWKRRLEQPIIWGILIFLLFQTHILLAGLGIALIAEFLIKCFVEKKISKRVIVGFFIAFLGLLFMYIELKQDSSTNSYINVSLSTFLGEISKQKILVGIFSIFSSLWNINKYTLDWVVLWCGTIAIGIEFLSLFIRKRWKRYYSSIIVWFLSFSYYFVIVIFVRNAYHSQLAICLLFIQLFLSWTIYEQREEKLEHLWELVYFGLWIVLSFVPVSRMIYLDINENFSNGKSMAQYIEQYVESDSVILVEGGYWVPVVYAYTSDSRDDITFWNVNEDSEYRCHIWNKDTAEYNIENISEYTFSFINTNVYFLSEEDLSGINGLELIYKEDGWNYSEENYWLYRLQR